MPWFISKQLKLQIDTPPWYVIDGRHPRIRLAMACVSKGWGECHPVDVRNPLAGRDGQHARAGKSLELRLAETPPSDGPQCSSGHTRRCEVQGRATWPIPGQEGDEDASLSFLQGIHVNVKYEPRSALRLSCESAQRADPPMIRTGCTNTWWSCLIKMKLMRSTTI